MKRYRAILALIATLSLLAGTVETTSAHSVYTWTETYASDTNCTKGYAEISHGTQDSGYSRVEVESRYRWETPQGATIAILNGIDPLGRFELSTPS